MGQPLRRQRRDLSLPLGMLPFHLFNDGSILVISEAVGEEVLPRPAALKPRQKISGAADSRLLPVLL